MGCALPHSLLSIGELAPDHSPSKALRGFVASPDRHLASAFVTMARLRSRLSSDLPFVNSFR